MNFELRENNYLQQVGAQFRRSPDQINQFLGSDAELLRLPDGGVLAATTDCISEEIATGLYHDPAHIGWMTVVVNLSDLAAVGAKPLGLLLSESLPPIFLTKNSAQCKAVSRRLVPRPAHLCWGAIPTVRALGRWAAPPSG